MVACTTLLGKGKKTLYSLKTKLELFKIKKTCFKISVHVSADIESVTAHYFS